MKIASWFGLFVISIVLAMVTGDLVSHHEIIMAAGCALGCIACFWYVEQKMKKNTLMAKKFCLVMVGAFLVMAVGMVAINLISHINTSMAFLADIVGVVIWCFRRYGFQCQIEKEKDKANADVKAIKEINFI